MTTASPQVESLTPRTLQVGIRSELRIAERWGLTDSELGQLLGGRAPRTIRRWRASLREGLETGLPKQDEDLLERLSLLTGIYMALHTLFSDAPQANGWLRRPNSAHLFEGQSALTYMLTGDLTSMWQVRRYLDAQIS